MTGYGYKTHFNKTADETVQTIKADEGKLMYLEFQSLNLLPGWLQLFDATSPTVGSDEPKLSIYIAGGDGTTYYATKIIDLGKGELGVDFKNAIKYAFTTTVDGNGAMVTNAIVNALYL